MNAGLIAGAHVPAVPAGLGAVDSPLVTTAGGSSSADVGLNALTGDDINEETLALPNIRTTAVSSTGQKLYGSGTVTRQEEGIYNVDYGASVTA